jgi:hypothetical protein
MYSQEMKMTSSCPVGSLVTNANDECILPISMDDGSLEGPTLAATTVQLPAQLYKLVRTRIQSFNNPKL